MSRNTALTIVMCAGAAAHASDSHVPGGVVSGDVERIAHIYYNVGTGEMVVTLNGSDRVRNADGGDEALVWNASGNACEGFPGGSELFYYEPPRSTAPDGFTNPYAADWGDIPSDTAIDCVQLNWVTGMRDTDTDNDSFADGIAGTAMNWMFVDGFDPVVSDPSCIAAPLVSFGFFNLPGLPPNFTGTLGQYTVEIDLSPSGTFGSDLSFELGDTDSDAQGMGNFDPRRDLQDDDSDGIPDLDPDQDGLADWGWFVQPVQPGTVDVDNADGDNDESTGIDGDVSDQGSLGVELGVLQPGVTVYDPVGDTYVWDILPEAGGDTMDALVYYQSESVGYEIVDFGGLYCGDPARPYAGLAIQMFGPDDQCDCPADQNGDCVFDFFDIMPCITTQCDLNGDTEFDYFDIVILLEGCR